MLKKLRRYSSRSLPVKKFVRIHVTGVTFDAGTVNSKTTDQFRVTFSRSKRSGNSACRKLDESGNKILFNDVLSLGVTFYNDSKGNVMEKLGTLSLQILNSTRLEEIIYCPSMFFV